LGFGSPRRRTRLRWARATGDGERHVRDARGVYMVQKETLEAEYLTNWAARLGVADLWEGIRTE